MTFFQKIRTFLLLPVILLTVLTTPKAQDTDTAKFVSQKVFVMIQALAMGQGVTTDGTYFYTSGAATALNVVYPAYYRGAFIRSYTPGRVWDSFYTWDCGMLAVGLTAIDRAKALDCLRAYLMPQQDPQTPYLNHGSPLLTQMFAFKLLLDRGETRLDIRVPLDGDARPPEGSPPGLAFDHGVILADAAALLRAGAAQVTAVFRSYQK